MAALVVAVRGRVLGFGTVPAVGGAGLSAGSGFRVVRTADAQQIGVGQAVAVEAGGLEAL